jgi:hypothetical protein
MNRARMGVRGLCPRPICPTADIRCLHRTVMVILPPKMKADTVGESPLGALCILSVWGVLVSFLVR